MSTAVSARVAGFVFLVYIAAGLESLSLTQAVAESADAAEKLAGMAKNITLFRYAALLDLACAFSACILAVTLYTITAAHGATAALLAMVCRLVEGMLIATSLLDSLGVLWLAGRSDVASEAVQVLAAYAMRSEVTLTSIFFAAGSFLFACLFVRGRLVPAPLAWLGVLASLTLLVVLPPQLVGFLSDPRLLAAWLPMLLFEVPLALWLLVKGAPDAS